MLTEVHFSDLVSLKIVSRVVEQGKWNMENTQVHIAVFAVHPFAIKISLSSLPDE